MPPPSAGRAAPHHQTPLPAAMDSYPEPLEQVNRHPRRSPELIITIDVAQAFQGVEAEAERRAQEELAAAKRNTGAPIAAFATSVRRRGSISFSKLGEVGRF